MDLKDIVRLMAYNLLCMLCGREALIKAVDGAFICDDETESLVSCALNDDGGNIWGL